ncbi:MAG: hypothetical protein ACM3Q2_08805 [Syntrophothermus sp.]|jgi:hypothetical protein
MGVTLDYFSVIKHAVLLSSIILAAFLSGCGPSSLTLNPNYNNPALHKDTINANCRVIKVVDNRRTKTKAIGFARVGVADKKVPYYVDGTIEEFVKSSINKLVGSELNRNSFVPITVVVDSFAVYEEKAVIGEKAKFDCNLRFLYPYKKDSIRTIPTRINEEAFNIFDATDTIEGLIYKSIDECTDHFTKTFNEDKAKYLVSPGEVDEIRIDSVVIASRDLNNDNSNDYLKPYPSPFFCYLAGRKIHKGFNVVFQKYFPSKVDRQLQFGSGYEFSYYDVHNPETMIYSYFIGISARYAGRYYLSSSKSRSGPYLGAAVKLFSGTENIIIWGNNKRHFFIGPTISEMAGVSINEKVFLEIGAFQMRLFGSEMLPYDTGFNAGIGFRL